MLEKSVLAARIAQAIAQSPYSQEGLAREFGITEQAVSGWVRTGKIGKGKLPKLAELTGMPLEYFLIENVSIGTDTPKFAHAHEPASQLQRPNPSILIATLDFLEKAFGSLGKEFSLRADADLFADAYEWLAEDDRPVDERNLVHFAQWRERQQKETTGDKDDAKKGRVAARETLRANRRRATG